MSANYTFPIKLTYTTLTGHETRMANYQVVPISVVESMFSVVIVGYTKEDTTAIVAVTKVINNNNREILQFLNENSNIEGYFIVYEPDKDKQNQIKQQLQPKTQLQF